MTNVNVDLMGQGMAQGEMAKFLASNGQINVHAMRPWVDPKTGRTYMTVYKGGDPNVPANYHVVPLQVNGTLRRDEWKQLDDALMQVSRQRLGGVDDLISRGLVYNLGNAMGTTVLEWHDVNDAFEASVDMDGLTRANNDRNLFHFNYLPIPIVHADYQINARALAASRSLGNPLDTTAAENAARRINEKLEDMLFTDTSYSFGEQDDRSRNTIYSYLNFPDRNILAFTSGELPGTHWDDSETTGANIVAQVLYMKQTSINAYHYGPWMLYIPTGYETVIDGDYDATTPGTTIRERIMKIKGILDIKVIDRLTADNLLLVEMNTNTVRMIRGFGLTNVEWKEEGNFVTKYKVFTIQVPQIRSDYNGKCGIVHVS